MPAEPEQPPAKRLLRGPEPAADQPNSRARQPTGAAVATGPSPAPKKSAAVAPLHGPWPQPETWAGRWPGPARPAATATVTALVVAAAIGAVSIPLDRGGLGWLVTALAGTAALIAARGSRTAHPPASHRR
jgi:hypothetical protein